jgi:putative salt-induced outer membrane protein YdiY
VPPDVYAKRGGGGVQKFSALTTSQAAPLEECGLRAVVGRLASLTCDDGQQPFGGNLEKAHASRSGNTGPGGRCGNIVDRYEVPCAERTYAVFADMYFCTAENANAF